MPRMIVFVTGVTCSGKSTLIDVSRSFRYHRPDQGIMWTHASPFGTVEVGRALRKLYPPGHFAGQGAPDHTADEALRIYKEQLYEQREKPIILVDGQPRNVNQLDGVIQLAEGAADPGMPLILLNLVLDCSPQVRSERIAKRFMDSPTEAEGVALAMQRIDRDAMDLYRTQTRLHLEYPAVPHIYVDTTDPTAVRNVLRHLFEWAYELHLPCSPPYNMDFRS